MEEENNKDRKTSEDDRLSGSRSSDISNSSSKDRLPAKPNPSSSVTAGQSAEVDAKIRSTSDNTIIRNRSSSSGSSSSRDYKHRHKKKPSRKKHSSESKKHKRKKRRSYSMDDDDDSSSSSTSREERKRKRRHHERKHKKKRHKYDSSESFSTTSSSSNDRRGQRKKTKKRSSKRSHSSKDERKEKKSNTTANLPTFGKYGILKESDFFTKQRDFEVWLSEVKQIPSFTGPKWELMNYFKEYCEDYNTATLPHEKYYNYDKWEMEEYNKKKASTTNISKTDEMRHLEELARKQEEKRRMELDRVRQSMNTEKIERMKRQQLLKHELELAYKTGDEAKRRKLQKQLEPDDARTKVGSAHPWSK